MSKKISDSLKKDIESVYRDSKFENPDFQKSMLGTLGGGNHFIEIDKDKSGKYYLIIHTGSRNFGKQIAQQHEYIARQQNHYFIKGLSYLTGDEAKKYIENMQIAQNYAVNNRRIIADEILYRMGWKEQASFESVHNYISTDGMIRKGAISAKNNERLLIPLNMRDGVILATGKGNKEWNCTAPHGAGRKYARSEAKKILSYEDFLKSMQKVYTTSIKPSTLDEAPDAYKPAEQIIDYIHDTAEIQEVLTPVYNYKDNGK